MYQIDDKTELDVKVLGDILNKFKSKELPQLVRWGDYYLGKQDILRKTASNQYKPCNRIVSNYCNTITTSYGGYLTGKEISYSSDKDIQEITDILAYNDVASEDNLLLRNALIYGVGYEMVYMDEESKQRMSVLDSRECIPVYSNTLTNELRAVIRFYKQDRISMDEIEKYYVEVYEDKVIRKYLSDAIFSSFNLLEEKPNYYGMVPISVFPLNPERESVFNKVMGLQDAYNTLISSSVDDFEAFADAYMVLSGMDADEEVIQTMKENRILIVPDGGKAEYLMKDIKTTQIENLLDRIDKKIHTVANCPDFADEAFGTSSGIAMSYKLLGFENAAGTIEKAMIKALQRRIELFCAIIHLTGGEEVWRDIRIEFHRNLPVDKASIASYVNTLRGIVPDKILLSMIPEIQDVDEAMKELEAQEKKNAELYSLENPNEE